MGTRSAIAWPTTTDSRSPFSQACDSKVAARPVRSSVRRRPVVQVGGIAGVPRRRRWNPSQRTAIAGRPRGGCQPCRCGRPGWCAPDRRARGLLRQGSSGSTSTVPRFKRSRFRSRMRSIVAPSSGWPGQTKVASGWPGTARSDFSKVIRSYLPNTGSPVPIRRSRWRISAGT